MSKMRLRGVKPQAASYHFDDFSHIIARHEAADTIFTTPLYHFGATSRRLSPASQTYATIIRRAPRRQRSRRPPRHACDGHIITTWAASFIVPYIR